MSFSFGPGTGTICHAGASIDDEELVAATHSPKTVLITGQMLDGGGEAMP